MQFRSLISTVLSVALGFIIGVVTVQILAPNLLSGEGRSGERLAGDVSARLVSAGSFYGVDSTRIARGRAQLLDGGDVRLLRFTEFLVSRAPHQEVWLASSKGIRTEADIRLNEVRRIAPLKNGLGDQVYILPDGLDLSNYSTVLIWCAEFGVLSAVAELSN